jgi:hypothetical protein
MQDRKQELSDFNAVHDVIDPLIRRGPAFTERVAILKALVGLIREARAKERERLIGIVTTLWGADLVTTQAVMKGEMSPEEAVAQGSNPRDANGCN